MNRYIRVALILVAFLSGVAAGFGSRRADPGYDYAAVSNSSEQILHPLLSYDYDAAFTRRAYSFGKPSQPSDYQSALLVLAPATGLLLRRRKPAGRACGRSSSSQGSAHAKMPMPPPAYAYDSSDSPLKPASYWPSRDPIEEEGGQNLYSFVGNNDGINRIDIYGLVPSGSAHADVYASIIDAGVLLWRVPTGVSSGMYDAWTTMATNYITSSAKVEYGRGNYYNQATQNFTFSGTDAPRVLHELVHQYTNPLPIGSENQRIDEGRAYTFEYMYRVLEDISKVVQKINTKDPKNANSYETLAVGWDKAWDFGRHDMQGETSGFFGGYFDITGADFARTRSKLGAQIRCYEIADELGKLADSKDFCIRFSCDHTETKGWEITGDLDDVKAQYVAPVLKELHESLK